VRAKAGKKGNHLSGEEAKLALARVMERYGFRNSGAESRDPISPTMGKVSGPRERTSDEGSCSKVCSPPIGPPLNLEWIPYPNISRAASGAGSGSAVVAIESSATRPEWRIREVRSFHYLIRIAECAQPLHCQVEAETSAAARHQVEQIRNLIECREISAEELGEVIAKEKAPDDPAM
jgi:hypothetical protein